MARVDWQSFWKSYRKTEITNEQDLFVEVGKTVNRRPIPEAAFQLSIDAIIHGLKLSTHHKLLELCCGNGLMTRRLAPHVGEIRAVDFAEHLIANARKFASAENVTFVCADVIAHLNDLALSKTYVPSKILLGDALCYFEPGDLGEMLRAVGRLTSNRCTFMATGIPCDERKWNFYSTPERVKHYKDNQRLPNNTNDGIGRWWRREELEVLGRNHNLAVTVTEQPHALSNFRIDAIFQSR